jgi:hypothetical protein
MGSDTDQDGPSKEDRARSVERMLEGEDPPVEPAQNDPGGSSPAPGTDDVGESPSRGGEEDASDDSGQEAGRTDTGDDSGTGRPAGTSTGRDASGVATDDPETDAPPMGGQGG